MMFWSSSLAAEKFSRPTISWLSCVPVIGMRTVTRGNGFGSKSWPARRSRTVVHGHAELVDRLAHATS